MTIETVEQVVALLRDYPVSEITLEQDGGRVYVRRGVSPPMPPAASAPVSSEAEQGAAPAGDLGPVAMPEAEPLILSAPMVGLFHHLSSPLRYGVAVAAGQVVGQIESMKLMNDVPAEMAGQVVEVLVEDGGAVEYGQPLFRLSLSGPSAVTSHP